MQSARAGFPPVSRLTLANFGGNYVSRFRVARLDTLEWARHMLDTDAFQVEGTLVGHGVYTLERPFRAWLSEKIVAISAWRVW
jgi:hypothetical protein